ncbi:hypothetical protein ABAC402_01280 [Asticcacaulis sp. AC402]|nr:hypothetical protein ABAC402_01280 [Asticcacaulis sp. AC402]
MEFDLHFFFDDHDFADDPVGMIGLALFDEGEAAAIAELVKAYAAALGPGSKMPDVRTVNWQPVAEAAQKAYTLILKGGEPTFR